VFEFMTTVAGSTSGASDANVDKVLDAFRDVLGSDAVVDVHSDFFDLGGNSVLGARLVANLRTSLSVKVTIRDVFKARTVAAVAEVVAERARTSGSGR